MALHWTHLVVSALSMAAALHAQRLTPEQMEDFLQHAKVVKTKAIATGVTNSVRATLSDGKLTHDAHVQTIDQAMAEFRGARGTELNFRDTYKYNIAAYRIGTRLLGLKNIPMSIERKFQGSSAAFTWWVDDTMMDEAKRLKEKIEPPDKDWWAEQMHLLRTFDQLIYNTDRNLGNVVISKDWRIWMIDHTRSFRLMPDLQNGKNLVKCERQLLDRMRALTEPMIEAETKGYLNKPEVKAMLKRRDKIVRHFENGAAHMLYDARPGT